jgi:cation diffusion facilitator CzcD-associated flavoprotein CzcO
MVTSAKNYPKELIPGPEFSKPSAIVHMPSFCAKVPPTTAPGCKRMIIDPEYLDSLNLPNVHLCASKIDEVTEDSIRLANGQEISVDAIIFATGFGIIVRSVLSS